MTVSRGQRAGRAAISQTGRVIRIPDTDADLGEEMAARDILSFVGALLYWKVPKTGGVCRQQL